jgi:hypothetical protein
VQGSNWRAYYGTISCISTAYAILVRHGAAATAFAAADAAAAAAAATWSAASECIRSPAARHRQAACLLHTPTQPQGPARSGLNRPGPGPAQPGRGLLDSLLLGNRPGPRDGCRIPGGGGGGAVTRRRRSRLPLVGRGRMMTFRPPIRVSCQADEARRRDASDVPPCYSAAVAAA